MNYEVTLTQDILIDALEKEAQLKKLFMKNNRIGF